MLERYHHRLSLPIEQGVLLWCTRVWVMEGHRPIGAALRIAAVLERVGAPDAGQPFEDFMIALQNGATRTIAIECVCQAGISLDEQDLLEILGLAQESRAFEALLLLRGLAHGAGANEALRHATAVGAALARVGWFLPAPEAALRQCAFDRSAR
jgi:hypothetical protein